jgi:hypothetical protein
MLWSAMQQQLHAQPAGRRALLQQQGAPPPQQQQQGMQEEPQQQLGQRQQQQQRGEAGASTRPAEGVPARIHSLISSLQHWLDSLTSVAGLSSCSSNSYGLGINSSQQDSGHLADVATSRSSSSSHGGGSSISSVIRDKGAVRLLQASSPSLPHINLIGAGDVGQLGVVPELQPSVRLYLDMNFSDHCDTLCKCAAWSAKPAGLLHWGMLQHVWAAVPESKAYCVSAYLKDGIQFRAKCTV